jgi:hypothetical protein
MYRSALSHPRPKTRCTRAPVMRLWSGPALACGAEFNVEIVTVSAALVAMPSLTTSCTT